MHDFHIESGEEAEKSYNNAEKSYNNAVNTIRELVANSADLSRFPYCRSGPDGQAVRSYLEVCKAARNKQEFLDHCIVKYTKDSCRLKSYTDNISLFLFSDVAMNLLSKNPDIENSFLYSVYAKIKEEKM
ncbi:unnamed protein product, partial [marine sediment metagenome]